MKEKMKEKMKENNTIKHGSMIVASVQTTRAICEEWKAKVPEYQRNLSSQAVKKIASDLEQGRWENLGDPIRFGDDGEFIDGNHRVTAFLRTGIFPVVLVVSGIENPKDSYGMIDDGQKRTHAQNFKALGIANYATAAAVSMLWAGYEQGLFHSTAVSKQECVASYYRHEKSILEAMNGWRDLDTLFPRVLRTLLYSVGLERFGTQRTEEFFTALVTGIGSSASQSLRSRLIKEANFPRRRISRIELLMLASKAMKAHMENRDLSALRWQSDEPMIFL